MAQWAEVKELFSNIIPTAFSVIGNTALAAVLYGLEYLVEKNSPCPCDEKWNAVHSDLAFGIPTVVLLLISIMVVPASRRIFMCATCRPCSKCGKFSRCPECKTFRRDPRCGTCSKSRECGICSGCSQCGICSGCSQCVRSSECSQCEKCSKCPKCHLRCQSCCNCCRKCCFGLNTLLQILTPSILWVLILLLDGDYVACYFAPSVNRTHGDPKCKEFCNLEAASSLREHCFKSRQLGSYMLLASVGLLVLLKFIPRWTYCDCTEVSYYKFIYQQELEEKKWSKMKEELVNKVAERATNEATALISDWTVYICDQDEQNPNQGEPNSTQGGQSSTQAINTNDNEGGCDESSA